MKRKGFTLIELLVVIAIIALLMGILMPALVKVRQLAQRVMCGTQVKGIGTSMMVYANDGEGRYPSYNMTWTPATLGDGDNGVTVPSGGCTVTHNFYLLVRYDYTTPDQFICGGDTGVSALNLNNWGAGGDTLTTLADGFDFGEEPPTHCSYSYHCPFSVYGLTADSDPRMAVAADRNPYLYQLEDPGTAGEKSCNCMAHQREGQNVLFNDNHVKFEKRAWCGVDDDNVYTLWPSNPAELAEKRSGTTPIAGSTYEPASRLFDSVLLSEEIPAP